MKSKKINVKKIIYITLLGILGVLFVASIAFGIIAAFIPEARESIEVWYAEKNEETLNLMKKSITWLLISASALVLTLSFKDFKNKYID